jgi:type II secretory pathway predicted ATPase ExeA
VYLSFYGLREQPFGTTPDPEYLFESAIHREALASLVYGIESDTGFSAVIAPPGMGKTTLLFHLLQRYRRSAHSAFIFDTQTNSHEFLQNLMADLELSHAGNDADLHNRFKEFLATKAEAGRRVLLLVDEAQNLSWSVLETVRLLSNFETPRKKLLHIVLSGQPPLEAKLARPEMLQLRQRITIFTRLTPFSPEETCLYIAHRLRIAGYTGPSPFSPEALAMIVAETRGVPREINRMCFNALSLGFALDKRVIDAELVREVTGDLRLKDGQARGKASNDVAGQQSGNITGLFRAPAVIPVVCVPGGQGDPVADDRQQNPEQQQPVEVPKRAMSEVPAKRVTADPFAPRPRRSAAPVLTPEIPRTAAEQAPTPKHPEPAPVAQPRALVPASPPTDTEEAETPELAMQRALLKVTFHRHTNSTHISLSGIAFTVPAVLWLIAYLIFRFDLVRLLHH